MAKDNTASFDEGSLTKGQLRKLNALRKSVGDEIGARAFSEWLESQPASKGPKADPNAEAIAASVWTLIEKKKVRIPRKGYILRRGRGRVVVEPISED